MTERNRLTDGETLTRRRALTALVGFGAALGLGCGDTSSKEADGGRDGGARSDAQAPGADASEGDAGSCSVSPEGEVGPYFADDSAAGFNRSSIVANLDGSGAQAGIPLTLTVTVLDAENGCAPYVDAQIDIWHCNASGVYSDIAGEGTSSEQWLRGYQITDANGQVTFKTIVPGWYAGRTTHIHLRVRSSYSEASANDDGTNTAQCFFEQAFIDTVDTTVAPYSAEGKNPTTNAGDRVYSQEEDGANGFVLSAGNASGYTASVTIRLPITTTYADDTNGPGGGPEEGGAGGTPGSGGPGGGPPSMEDGGGD